jgi:crotonobetainyl-CoA:carnitine CoA-transferase CaiB-like acyl-CoA transferase
MTPLKGVRVLDLGQYISGPFATSLLAEMGADVIKVESPPDGDAFRAWQKGKVSPQFLTFNHGKRSILLDLKATDQRASFYRLVKTADVLIENFRPGVTDRLGIGYEPVHEVNPKLVYCSITGFGADGPYADRPSYDSVAQGFSGLSSLLMNPEQPRLTGPAIADMITGQMAAFCVVSALAGRGVTGCGEHVEVNMLASLVRFITGQVAKQVISGNEEGPYTRSMLSQAYAFRTSEGDVLLIHLSSPDKFWRSLCAAVGREDLLTHPDFREHLGRVKHYDAVMRELEPVFATRTQAQWLEILAAHEVPCAPVNRISQALADPQVQHLGIVEVEQDEVLGRIPRFRPPVKWSGVSPALVRRPPTLGEHTEEILEELRQSR